MPATERDALNMAQYYEITPGVSPTRVISTAERFIKHFGLASETTVEIALLVVKVLLQQSRHADALTWLQRIIDANLPMTAALARSMGVMADYYRRAGQPDAGLALLHHIIDGASLDAAARAHTYCILALQEFTLGNTGAAQAAVAKAEELAAEIGDRADDDSNGISLRHTIIATKAQLKEDDELDSLFDTADPDWRNQLE